MRTVPFILVAATLVGCSPQTRSLDAIARKPEAQSNAVTASGPREITELTDQKQVHECPQCGMMFDAAGECPMDHATLVATQVSYVCPMDAQPVEKAGRCPRCPQNARVVRTAAVAPEPASQGATGN